MRILASRRLPRALWLGRIVRLENRRRRDASVVSGRYAQDPRQMLRRDRAILSPPVDRDGLDTTFNRDLFPRPDLCQEIFYALLHDRHNDYISHFVKGLKQ